MPGFLLLPLLAAALGAGPADEIDADIAALRDDDVRWNATEAVERLYGRGVGAVPALEAALDSDDWQQRQLAASVLCWLGDRYESSDRHLEVCVEALRDDDLPWARGEGNMFIYNARSATQRLCRDGLRARPLLRRSLESDDHQQKFLAAFVLGYSGDAESAEPVAAILIPHLRDNDVYGDATMAAAALYRLGAPVAPHLTAALDGADAQQRRTIEELLRDIAGPPRTDEQIAERTKPLEERLSERYRLAHIQFEIDRLEIRWHRSMNDPEARVGRRRPLAR